MARIGYFGTYARFVTTDKRAAAAFLGADNVIGDVFSIEMSYEKGKRQAWIVNPFGARMGLIDEEVAQQVDLCHARGWTVKALLALVAYSENPEPGYYWGEVALISYDSTYEEAFSVFIEKVGKKLGNGVRIAVDLGDSSVQEVINKKGDWLPSARVALPEREKGTAFVKTERSGTERLVDQARKGNPGCTALSWIFLLGLVTVVIFGLHSCGLF